MFSTFNNRNKNIIMVNNGTPYSNSKTQAYSKNSIAKIDFNNVYQNDPSFITMINDNINNNIDDNNNYYIIKQKVLILINVFLVHQKRNMKIFQNINLINQKKIIFIYMIIII